MNNKSAFKLPETPTSKVIYTVETFQGQPCVAYMSSTVIPTPKSTSELQVTMLGKHVALRQVVRLEAIQPPKDLNRPHPAQHKLTQYASAADH